MFIAVDVTKEHIRAGRRDDPFRDPIALALIDAGLFPVRVEYDHFVYDDMAIDLPEEAQAFIDAWDSGKEVPEIKFCLDIPENSNLEKAC